jgi:hypothetical protein
MKKHNENDEAGLISEYVKNEDLTLILHKSLEVTWKKLTHFHATSAFRGNTKEIDEESK